jgi:hypothetical protein
MSAVLERAVLEPARRSSVDLAQLRVELVAKRDSGVWNAYIERHHYLGHQPLPGAQVRYFVRAADDIVAVLGFGASAWKTQPRECGHRLEHRAAPQKSAPHRQQRALPHPAVD